MDVFGQDTGNDALRRTDAVPTQETKVIEATRQAA
jgi:hypothetical protein